MKLVPAFQNILNLSFSKLKSNDPSRSHRIFEPTDNYSPTTTTRLLLLMNIRLHGFCRNIHSSPRTQTRQTDRLAWKLLSRVRETLHLDLLLLASSSTSLRNCRCAGICRCTLSIRCWFSLSLSHIRLRLHHQAMFHDFQIRGLCDPNHKSLAATASHCISIDFPKPNPVLSAYIT